MTLHQARMTKEGRWDLMNDLITEEMLDAFVVRGRPEEIPGLLKSRFGSVVKRVSFNPLRDADPERWREVLALFRA